ncbi:MAG: hypothetical protein J7513_03420 [Solirubrobacteraceae bacterium]|nr:hypothetical protein [Solirubrobacteraceae bacterium]
MLAHVAGMPVEEMLGASPGALVLLSGAGAWWRARRSRTRDRQAGSSSV